MFEWKNKISKQAILVRAMKQDLQVEVAHHRAKRKKNGRTFINKLHACVIIKPKTTGMKFPCQQNLKKNFNFLCAPLRNVCFAEPPVFFK